MTGGSGPAAPESPGAGPRVTGPRVTGPRVTGPLCDALAQDPTVSAEQARLLCDWLPGATVRADHSWGLVARTVLEVEHGDARLVVKAGGPDDNHMARELRAHQQWLGPWTATGRAPELLHGDAEHRVVVTRYLPGELVQDSPHRQDPGVFTQAGELLAMLHDQSGADDRDLEARENARALAWLDGRHRIGAEQVARLRAEIASWPTPTARVVPTHGDWSPRNWLVHHGRVSVIDFGRAGLRPALTDLNRLAARDFATSDALEEAFLDGYGSDPREPGAWHRSRVREAIGTAAWAHQVGDTAFEAEGHAMIAAALGG